MRTRVGHFHFGGVLLEKLDTYKNVKPPTTFQQQVELIKNRGALIYDEDEALKILKRTNYYRLSAYFLSLKEGKDQFKKGVTFEKIYSLYEFDRKLRILLLEYLESIEIAFRTHITYLLAHKYGPLCYLYSQFFENEQYHKEFLGKLMKEIEAQKGKELFIKHHLDKYDGHFPIWAAIEVTSFGWLSKLYSNMKKEDKKAIAREYYNVSYVYLVNWLHVLGYIRNVCAHFGRLYNKPLAKRLKLSKKENRVPNDRIFAVIFVMKKLLPTNDWRHFVTRLEALIEQYEDNIELDRIGFPTNWRSILRE